jgi:hypothetical protein
LFLVLSGLGADPPRTEDLLTVAGGFYHLMTRFSGASNASGANLDGSFSWTVTEEEAVLAVLECNNYRFYLAGGDNSETVSLQGRLSVSGGRISGSLSVEGVAVPELRFSEFALWVAEDSATADRPCISIGDDSYSAKEAETFLSNSLSFFDESRIIDAEKESLFMFLFSFAAPSFLTWEDGSRIFPYSDTIPPRGEFTGDPSMSLGAVALDRGTKFIYQDFLFTDSVFPIAPLLTGAFDMLLPPEEEEGAYVARLDGTIEAKNLRFVRSLRYDACIVADDLEDITGTLSIDGRAHKFSDFITVMNSQF